MRVSGIEFASERLNAYLVYVQVGNYVCALIQCIWPVGCNDCNGQCMMSSNGQHKFAECQCQSEGFPMMKSQQERCTGTSLGPYKSIETHIIMRYISHISYIRNYLVTTKVYR